LALPSPPSRIEAYDISHLGGTETVGSMVVAIEGKTRSDQYRTFAVRSVARGLVDDYASLREVLTRRLRHAAGGLKGEARQWMAQGIVITKAKKADNDIILGLIRSHPEELSDDDIDAKQFFVARQESTVVACARLWPLPDRGPILLRSVLVIPEWRGKRLGQFLVRTMLATMKKGKVYVTIDPALEQYYAEVGFRHVIKPPSAITAFLQSFNAKPDTLVMVYDALQHKPDVSLQSVPDLLVIDGGKGQLAVGIEVTKALGLSIPVISLAKREEDVYASTSPDPVALGKESAAQFLLQRLRDEAHRFANTLRERRGWKQTIRSSLDELPGIGPATKRELLKRFGSVESIRAASDDALREIVTEAQMKTLRGMGES
jgi:N-acetylglutamate synthase-like GNAT family acetyltransferase